MFYEKISVNDAFDLFGVVNSGDQLLIFDDHEIRCLRKFGEIGDIHNNHYDSFYTHVTLNDRNIYKLPDEWYIVYNHSDSGSGRACFKCDQLEGLMRYLFLSFIDNKNV